MKLNQAIISLIAGASLALSGQAATTNILDWQFSTADNPASPTPGTTVNPDGGNPLATFTGDNNTYYPGTGGVLAGSPTGLWEMLNGSTVNGHLTLTMDAGGIGTGDYILQVFQFVDSTRSFYPGSLTFSIGQPDSASESVYVPQTGSMIGSWYESTYAWSAVNLTTGITLDMSGAGGPNTGVFFDEVRLTVVGNLGPVPEPSSSVIAAVGLMVLGIRSWIRRRA